jgi:uncharacterized membrane protein YciS (DUF1049 family)
MAVIIGFAFYNSGKDQTVDVDLIWMQRYDVPLITVVFWSFLLGVVISWLLFVTIYLKQYNQIRHTKRMVKGLQTEVTALRNRPIEESKDFLEQENHRQE